MRKNDNLRIREATPEDVPAINAIYNHYVDHTIVTFALSRMSDEKMLSKYKTVIANDLPFLVADIPSPDEKSKAVVTGYAYLFPYREDRLAYQYTVEISIYLHHEYRSLKTGSHLMDHILEKAKNTKIREIIAVMAINKEEKDEGMWLRDWYGRWGFEQAGRLKKVGLKFGLWIDTLLLQLSLPHPND